MQLLAFSAAAATFVTLTLGYPAPGGHEYQAPGATDLRSPCPGLNALANHAFINRNGSNITVAQLVTGGAGMGFGPDVMTLLGKLALLSPAKPNFKSFNLNQLDEHNFPIEHDASLSRQDYYFAHDDYDFYEPNYEQFIGYFSGMTSTSLDTAAAARYSRVNNSLHTNPKVVYGPAAFMFSYGESGMYTQAMGSSPNATSAPVAFVRSLFEQERLPYELGWQPSSDNITLASLGAYAVQLYNATSEKLPEGIEVFTIGLYRQILADRLAVETKIKKDAHKPC